MIENFDSNANRADLGMDDESIIRTMETRMNQALLVHQSWRDIEVKENFDVYSGNQWALEDVDRQISNNMPILTINRVKPVLKAIVGFAIQTNPDVTYAPRLNNDQQNEFKDMMNSAVKYLEQRGNSQMAYNLAFEDMLLCGVGVTDTVFNYDKPPHNGDYQVERVFPGFVFYDPAARAKNITDAEWVVRLKIVDRRIISEEYGVDYYDDIYSVALDARILQFFSTVLAVKDLGVVYEYQWRRKIPFYRVENPFRDLEPEQLAGLAMEAGMDIQTYGQLLLLAIQEFSKEFNFNPQIDQVFTIADTEDYGRYRDVMKGLGIKIKKAKQFRYQYERAIITGKNVVKKSANFSQTGYSIKFMTGEFSETTQNYYGLMRACKPAQRMLNQAVSDYQGYLRTVPKGGVNIEVDAVEDINAFINTYTKASMVTVFNPGALSSGKVVPKLTPPLPPGMLEMIQYADNQIMQVCGVTPELMGMMTTKEQNSSFLRQQLRQANTTLASYFDARSMYFQLQGQLYIDCIRVLLENSEGTMIRDVIGSEDGDAKEIPLLKDNVAPAYDIIVEEMPASPEEKQETFEKLMELVQFNPGFLPLALEYAPFNQKVTAQLKALMQPPPPPQPDPVNQQLLMSESEYKSASAAKLIQEAQRIQIENQFIGLKGLSEIELNSAKAAHEVAQSRDIPTKNKQDLFKHLTTLSSTADKHGKDHARDLFKHLTPQEKTINKEV